MIGTAATQHPRYLRILIVMRHGGYVRNYDSVLAELAARGHEVLIGFEVSKSKLRGEAEALDELVAQYANLRQIEFPPAGDDRRHRLARALRLALDYLRYLGPEFRDADTLRARARDMAPAPVRVLGRVPGVGRTRIACLVARLVRAVERRTGIPATIVDLLRKRRPDVVLVTPLVQFGGSQTDVLRAARRVGVPTGVLVASWDNLTNKGLIHEVPDRVIVWNETQRAEASQLHGVAPDRVVVTGANSYDHWFTWSPRSDREEFCARIGLPADRPLVLYLSSSPFIAADEVPFVRRWLAAVRLADDTRVRRASVLVRPHPLAGPQWQDVDLASPAATVWPRAGANPTDDASRSDLYDSIFHSSAVVGLNTSAQIESAIVDRPVLTVLDPAFAGSQEGTLHFRYLPRENGGPLLVARTLQEHLDQLAACLISDGHMEANRRFLEHFVRPHGVDHPATPRVVRAIEELGGLDAPLFEPVGH